MITPTGGEDDEAEMVKGSQERRSSIQVSLKSESAGRDEKWSSKNKSDNQLSTFQTVPLPGDEVEAEMVPGSQSSAPSI